MKPSTARQSFERAMQLLHAGDAAAAAEICRCSLETEPDDVDLLTLLGVALLDGRQPREALPVLQRAVALAPRFARARENLGQALTMTGRFDEAVEQLQQAVKLEPNSEAVHIKLAHALARGGKADEADAIYEQAFGLAPEFALGAYARVRAGVSRVAGGESRRRERLASVGQSGGRSRALG